MIVHPGVTDSISLSYSPGVSYICGGTVTMPGWVVMPLCRYTLVFTKPKLEYNTMHPYTSWIPILCWIVVRLTH